MIFDRFFQSEVPAKTGPFDLQVGMHRTTLVLVPHPRAKRYLLRVRADGVVQVTLPVRGTVAAAKAFVGRNLGWLERQLQLRASRPQMATAWTIGTEILFRGEKVRIERRADSLVGFGAEQMVVVNPDADLRPAIQSHLRRLATRELPPRVLQWAATHGIAVARVTVRDQKTRWGSCSRRGTISLNWRLIQTPVFVCDYIILHELAHRRQMNHSARFWQEVERLCPAYELAEQWLKQHRAWLKTETN